MNPPTTTRDLSTLTADIRGATEAHLEETGGLLRLSPTWVPRSFLQPGLRLKLHPDDTYAYGLSRGGIDERWFGSTTPTANEGRSEDEGLSYIVVGRERFTLLDAINECGAEIIGEDLWEKYRRWPVYSKFFDNMGPIPHHLHQNAEQAALVGREGKPESYYFPPQHNNVGNNFPYTFMGLEPGTTREQVYDCIAHWHRGDNRILELSKAYKLQAGTGWLIDPGILHAPGSLCTYEPQWGSDVFGMYQNLVEGREVPRSLLVKDMPEEKHDDIDFIIGQIDWEKNLDPHFKDHHYLEPVTAARGEDFHDKWIVYGTIDGFQPFTAKELTIAPRGQATIRDRGAFSAIVVQGEGSANQLRLTCPKLLRFHELSEDEFFATERAAREGIVFKNTSDTEPLVLLRYFGPAVHPEAPAMGAYRK